MHSTAAKQAIFSQIAKAKLMYYAKKETYKIVVAFNVTETNANGNYKFPPQAKCNFVSGDICYATLQADVERVVAQAKAQLRTDNIVFVD